MVPERTRRAEACPVSVEMRDWRVLVVGSSPKTSSRRVVCVVACSMEDVGVVTTSERKSEAEGPGVSQGLEGWLGVGWEGWEVPLGTVG